MRIIKPGLWGAVALSLVGWFAATGIARATGTIVPLYSDPSEPPWSAIISAKNSHPTVPVIAVINAGDPGGPGPAVDPQYTSGIADLQAAGITVVGYVATGNALRPEGDIQGEVRTWKLFYPSITGIFFDEMSNDPGDVAFYQHQDSYARTQGFTYTVGNPGTETDPSYVGVVNTLLVYESSGVPTSSLPSWYASYAPTNFGVIPYNVPNLNANATSFIATARQTIGYIYLTNDDLDNPWDTLSSYFSGLLDQLQ